MINADTDIDIDFADKDVALLGLKHIPALIMNEAGAPSKHLSGVYFQNIPICPLTATASIPYKEAPKRGYFKIDFLNQSVYKEVRDEDHLIDLLNREPIWELLDEPEMVSQLAHIHNHYDIVQKIAPRSIEDLAVVIALIRPGKRHLLSKTRDEIDAEIWTKNEDDLYVFKRAHALSYAALIVVQMNRVCELLQEE